LSCEPLQNVYYLTMRSGLVGFVSIPQNAPWLAEYLHEMTVFPNGKHDDQVDSTAQFLEWFKTPFIGQNIYELYQRDAEAAEQRRQPQPAQTVWQQSH